MKWELLLSDFYKNIALKKEERNGKEVYILVVKISEQKEEHIILKPDQLEHIISQYRLIK